jgi:hypothetical protein
MFDRFEIAGQIEIEDDELLPDDSVMYEDPLRDEYMGATVVGRRGGRRGGGRRGGRGGGRRRPRRHRRRRHWHGPRTQVFYVDDPWRYRDDAADETRWESLQEQLAETLEEMEEISERLDEQTEEIEFLRRRRTLMRELLARHGLLKQLPPAQPPRHLVSQYG